MFQWLTRLSLLMRDGGKVNSFNLLLLDYHLLPYYLMVYFSSIRCRSVQQTQKYGQQSDRRKNEGKFFFPNFGEGFLLLLNYQKAKGESKESSPPKSLLPFNVEDLTKCSEDSLKVVNAHLESRSYLIGYEPSSLDKDACKNIKGRKSFEGNSFPSLHRWLCHIDSFTAEEQNKFTVRICQNILAFHFFISHNIWLTFSPFFICQIFY